MPDFEIEKSIIAKGYDCICGVDEAGRGPLAGPVCAAAVILPEDCVIEGLDDSKKLSEKKREALFDVVIEKAIDYSICYASVTEIDNFNILNATFFAMNRAINSLGVRPDFCLIDGNREPKGILFPCQTVVKGDSKSYSIAAASILAKVSRDRLMLQYDKEFPQYNFAKHKGYGTKEHYEAIRKYGVCNIHRLTFLKNVQY